MKDDALKTMMGFIDKSCRTGFQAAAADSNIIYKEISDQTYDKMRIVRLPLKGCKNVQIVP